MSGTTASFALLSIYLTLHRRERVVVEEVTASGLRRLVAVQLREEWHQLLQTVSNIRYTIQ